MMADLPSACVADYSLLFALCTLPFTICRLPFTDLRLFSHIEFSHSLHNNGIRPGVYILISYGRSEIIIWRTMSYPSHDFVKSPYSLFLKFYLRKNSTRNTISTQKIIIHINRVRKILFLKLIPLLLIGVLSTEY